MPIKRVGISQPDQNPPNMERERFLMSIVFQKTDNNLSTQFNICINFSNVSTKNANLTSNIYIQFI